MVIIKQMGFVYELSSAAFYNFWISQLMLGIYSNLVSTLGQSYYMYMQI